MNKNNILILGAILSMLLIGLFSISVSPKDEPVATAPVENKDELNEPVAERVAPEGWQTYRNEELGFSVFYPEGWFAVDSRDKNRQRSADAPYSVSIGFDFWSMSPSGQIWGVSRYDVVKQNSEKQIEIYISQKLRNYDPADVSRKNVNLNGYSAIKITTTGFREIVGTAYYIAFDEYIYVVHASDYSNVDNVSPEMMLQEPFIKRYNLLKDLGSEYPEIFLNSFQIIE